MLQHIVIHDSDTTQFTFYLGHEIEHYQRHKWYFVYCNTCRYFSSLKLQNRQKKNVQKIP